MSRTCKVTQHEIVQEDDLDRAKNYISKPIQLLTHTYRLIEKIAEIECHNSPIYYITACIQK